jgi:hypothetical protein
MKEPVESCINCCPEFDTTPWDKKTHVWDKKPFLYGEVKQFLHIPLNMSQVVNQLWYTAQHAGVAPSNDEFLLLSYDPSPWKSEVHMSITKPIPDEPIVYLSGTFVSMVFDGPYQAVPKWIKTMDAYLASNRQKALKYFFHYAYCPKCSKRFDHNYCIAFAQIA